ncbi:MAG: hypothetical protein E2O50_06025 [Gammaproteobacteria bacterium]|nr:MAG: hypothetical protein E2O50_06025 [Gammaproteobacteria bacterium]
MSEQNLRTEDLDRLGQALITLTKELWVVKDRVRVLEATLTDAGVMVPGAVDQFQPDTELGAALSADRAQLIEQVLGALAPDN